MYGEIIRKEAANSLVPVELIAAVIVQESRGVTTATRYEPAFYETYLRTKTRSQLSGWLPSVGELPSFDTEKKDRATSYGLMQVMGDTARWCAKLAPDGTDPLDPRRYIASLTIPEIGIACGAKVLAYCLYLERATTDPDEKIRRALSRYNSGSPTSMKGLAYAGKVMKIIKDGMHKGMLA